MESHIMKIRLARCVRSFGNFVLVLKMTPVATLSAFARRGCPLRSQKGSPWLPKMEVTGYQRPCPCPTNTGFLAVLFVLVTAASVLGEDKGNASSPISLRIAPEQVTLWGAKASQHFV